MMTEVMERTWGGLRKGSAAELLEWHEPANGDMPDADLTVLLWVQDGQVADWCGGWWDGDAWRMAESGGVCAGVVLAWAEPAGPTK